MAMNSSAWVARTPSIVIITNTAGGLTSQVLLQCVSNTARLTAEDSDADNDSFCNPDGTIPGSSKWTASFDVLLTLNDGTDTGSWNTLHPLRRTKQTFVLKPQDATVTSANPSATFQAWIPSIPFMDHESGDTARFTFELSVLGDPVFATT